jgi:hypothetical protein
VTEPEPLAEPANLFEVSEQRMGQWHPFWRVAYAILTGIGLLVMCGVDVVVAGALLSGALTISAGLGATLAVATVLPVMTVAAARLFWSFGIKSIADLRTAGEFSRTRSESFKKADRRFAMITLLSLFVIPFVPILMVLD